MDLISLRYFAETARQRSVSKAAASLGIVQPALTRRIQLLEDRLGVPLLLRHRRGVEPTEAGLIVLERADLLLRMAQQLETEISTHGGEPAGHVALGFPPSLGILAIGKLLSECTAKFPRIKLFLQEDYTSAVRSALLSGRLDIGIMSCEATHPELALEPLFRESTWLIGRAQSWPFSKTTVLPADLDQLPLIIGSFMRLILERHIGRTKIGLNIVAEADSLSLAREAVKAGGVFFVAPGSALRQEITSGELMGVPIKGLEVTRGLFRHRNRPLSHAASKMCEMIHAEISQLCLSHPKTFRPIAPTASRPKRMKRIYQSTAG
jgi:LysR family nitrogen assimilation transcriptional regulator